MNRSEAAGDTRRAVVLRRESPRGPGRRSKSIVTNVNGWASGGPGSRTRSEENNARSGAGPAADGRERIATHSGPLIPPSLRMRQKWIAMRNPVARGNATT